MVAPTSFRIVSAILRALCVSALDFLCPCPANVKRPHSSKKRHSQTPPRERPFVHARRRTPPSPCPRPQSHLALRASRRNPLRRRRTTLLRSNRPPSRRRTHPASHRQTRILGSRIRSHPRRPDSPPRNRTRHR